MNRARQGKGRKARLTIELEALAAGPVSVDGSVAAAPPDPPPGRRAATARRRGRRPGRRPAQLVRLLPATRGGRIPALEGRPEQPVHLAAAAPGRRRRRAGLELERHHRQRLRFVARHGRRFLVVSWIWNMKMVREKWREGADRRAEW
jgi:hypothetical protein